MIKKIIALSFVFIGVEFYFLKKKIQNFQNEIDVNKKELIVLKKKWNKLNQGEYLKKMSNKHLKKWQLLNSKQNKNIYEE